MKWTNHITVENRLLQRHDQVHVHVHVYIFKLYIQYRYMYMCMLVDLTPSHSYSPSRFLLTVYLSFTYSPSFPPSLPPSSHRVEDGLEQMASSTLCPTLLDTHIRPALLAYDPTQNITLAPVRTSSIHMSYIVNCIFYTHVHDCTHVHYIHVHVHVHVYSTLG